MFIFTQLRRITLAVLVALALQMGHVSTIWAQSIPVELQPYATALRPGFERDLLALVDAPRYDIEITIDPEQRVISGTQRTRYVNRENVSLNELVVRLYPNTAYMGGGMALQAVQLDGRPVRTEPFQPTVFADGSAIRVVAAAPIKPKQVVELRANFVITAPLDPKNGYTTFGMMEGVLALPNAYAMVAPRAEDGWLAMPAPVFGDIVQSEMALYRVTIHAPHDFVVVASGVCEAQPPSPKSKRATVTQTCVAAPVRDFAVHLSRFYKTLTSVVPGGNGDNVIVRSYFTSLRARAGQNALLYLGEALRVFERRFGPYPYRELAVFESTTIAGGIEYPGAVGVNYSEYQQDGGYMEWITAHEVAHQWWYGMVGSDPIREAWLDEALAQYSASLYIEDRYGVAFADAERHRFFDERYNAEVKERGDERVGQPSGAFFRWAYAPMIYGKAPLFFSDIRERVGDARFTQWLKRYFAQNRFGIARSSGLLRAADEAGIGPIVREAYARRIASR